MAIGAGVFIGQRQHGAHHGLGGIGVWLSPGRQIIAQAAACQFVEQQLRDMPTAIEFQCSL